MYSIAPEAASAIIMAGHAGNSAFWISDYSGKWATTTYYKEVPTIISTRNFASPLASRLDTLSWTPSMPVDRYPDLPDYKKYYPFRHTFGAGNHDRFTMFKQSAPVNREITSVAVDYLKALRLGTRGAMDMLNLGYTVMPYPEHAMPTAASRPWTATSSSMPNSPGCSNRSTLMWGREIP